VIVGFAEVGYALVPLIRKSTTQLPPDGGVSALIRMLEIVDAYEGKYASYVPVATAPGI
jgi:hypothetical protein